MTEGSMDTNLAAVLHGKGDLRMDEMPIPEPKGGEVLVSVRKAGVCITDVHMLDEGSIGSLSVVSPTVIGHEFAGIVSKVGPGVTSVKPGDRVAADPMGSCGLCLQCKNGRLNTCLHCNVSGFSPTHGGLARFTIIPEKCAHILPDSMDFDQGALTEPLAVVVNASRKTGISPGDTVLVFGAGPIGLLALQVARAMGATTVCVTDLDGERLKLAKELGAAHTVQFLVDTDAQKNAKKLVELVGDADVAIECTGAQLCVATAIYALRPGGNVVLIGIGPDEETIPISEAILKEISIRGSNANSHCFPAAIKLVETGKVKTLPLISHRFPLSQAVEALDLVRKRKCIKTVIDCSKPS